MVVFVNMSAKKSKALRHGTTRIEAIRSAEALSERWPLLTIRLCAALGLCIAAYISILHYQAGASGPIESPLCSVGTAINCNEVLGSMYARLFGLPVAFWATATYAVLLLLSFSSQLGLLVLLCGWTFAFSLYMAGVSFLVIRSVCLFCLSLYAVNTGVLIGALALLRSSAVMAGRQLGYSLAGYAVLVGGLGWWQAQARDPMSPPPAVAANSPQKAAPDYERYYNSRPVVTLRGAARHTKGPTQAVITISEFADFRCPTCAQASEVLKQVRNNNPNDIRVVFHHYPLDQDCNPGLSRQVHASACVAAFAAECAAEQGKFWEYADLLFVDQKVYTRQDLETYAGALSLDIDRFNSCLDTGRTKLYVQEDIDEASRVGIKATPTLIINGRLIEGLPTAEQFAALLEIEKRQLAKR